MEAEGRFVLQSGGRCLYGRVWVRYRGDPPGGPSEPRAEAAPGLSADRTYLPEWVEAAVSGAASGLESAGVPGRCVVTRLHNPDLPSGIIRPWTVAVAAVRAAWAAVGFSPDEATALEVESRVAGQFRGPDRSRPRPGNP